MRNKIDYSITPVYFYRFVCNDPNIINMYVGSSINLTDRKTHHKSACNNPNSNNHHLLVYKTIRDNGGWTNWRMLEIEHKIVKDKTEANQCEQYWIEFYNAQMNMIKATINIQEYQREYYEQRRDKYNREYYEQHRDKYNAYNREYYEQHRDKYNAKNREYKKQHREQINAYQREYRKLKKEQKLMSAEDIRIL